MKAPTRAVVVITLLVAGGAGALADPLAYMDAGGQFGTIDLATGGFSALGSIPFITGGFGVADGKLYVTTSTGTLYHVNTANGSVARVGSSGVSYYLLGSTLTGLYALDLSMDLYSINASTGAASLIGPTGLVAAFFGGLSTNARTLYLSNDKNLYTLDTATGAPTEFAANIYSLGIGPMVMEGGTLFAGQQDPNTRVDEITGISGFPVNQGPSVFGTANGFNGLAPDPLPPVPTPEPATAWLMMVGLAGIFQRAVRRK